MRDLTDKGLRMAFPTPIGTYRSCSDHILWNVNMVGLRNYNVKLIPWHEMYTLKTLATAYVVYLPPERHSRYYKSENKSL